MNKGKLRRFFRDQRQLIAALREEIESSHYYHEEAVSRANWRADAERRESVERERQVEADRWYREDELRRATKDLERARSYGDEWGESRAIQKLKRLT